MRKLTLQLEHQSVFVPNVTDGYRIVVTATDPEDMDPNIFIYSKIPTIDGSDVAGCLGICTVPDYVGLPVGAPAADDPEGRFRLDYLDQVYRTRSVAVDVWNNLCVDLQRLVQSLKDGDTLVAGDSFTVEL